MRMTERERAGKEDEIKKVIRGLGEVEGERETKTNEEGYLHYGSKVVKNRGGEEELKKREKMMGSKKEQVVRKRERGRQRQLHLNMKGTDRARAISKGNIITFLYILLESDGGRATGGSFKSNNPSLEIPTLPFTRAPSFLSPLSSYS